MIKVLDKEYNDIDEALASIDDNNSSNIEIDLNGYIFKQVVINKPNVTLKNGTIDYNLGAYEILDDGYKRGTFRTYTLFVDADNVRIENVTIKNSNGYNEGQTIALMINGDNFKAVNSTISSYQDTLFIAPLPEKEYEAGGFRGPLENRERRYCRAFFEKCLIEGSIDFIFGGGMGYFENCEIKSLNIFRDINGFVCAPSTPENKEYGFIFNKCNFTSEDNMNDSVYLARPWRDYGKCMIVNSDIGSHIKAEGYHDWDKVNARKTCEFKEYENRSSIATNRVEWMKEVSKKDLEYINSLREEK